MQKFRWLVTLALIVAGWTSLATSLHAETTAAVYFSEPLQPYGRWVDDPYYGRVWVPNDRSPEWRPYLYGRWVWTSDYGWVWVSEEPWGWATYHYGRWVWTSDYGWVWVPDTTWGPAWVEWCYGAGYAGWSPMPPDPYWRDGYYYGSYDCAAPRYRAQWVFVAEVNLTGPRISAVAVAPSQNGAIAVRTKNVTAYARTNGSVINRSIDVARLEAVTGKKIVPARVLQASKPVPFKHDAGELRTLSVYRPKLSSVKAQVPGQPGRLKLEAEPKDFGAPATDLGRSATPDVDVGTLPTRQLPGGVNPDPSFGGGVVGGAGRTLGGIPGRFGR